jgi:hypothetical protein
MEDRRESIYLDLREIVDKAPEGLQLSSIGHRGNSITVSGTASGVDDIFGYARDLRDKSPRFSEVWVSPVSGSEGAFSFGFALTKP